MAESEDIAARFQKAVQHKIVGEYDEAIALFQSILAEAPEYADAHHELGLVYSFLVLDECITELERAVELAPQNVKYLNDLGKTHAMFGDYDKAVPVFEKVLEIDPFNDVALQNLSFLR